MAEADFTFEAVRQRFDQSVEALTTLKQQLETLDDAQKHQARVSESVTDASSRLQEMTTALGSSTRELEAAMADLRSVAGASAAFLEGEELKAARSDVAALRDEVDSSLSKVRQGSQALQQQVLLRMDKHEAALVAGMQDAEKAALDRNSQLESALRGDSQQVQNRLSDLEAQISTKLAQTEAALDAAGAELGGARKRLEELEAFRAAILAVPRLKKALAKAAIQVPPARSGQ